MDKNNQQNPKGTKINFKSSVKILDSRSPVCQVILQTTFPLLLNKFVFSSPSDIIYADT